MKSQLLQINLNYLESVSWGQMCTSATQRRNRLSSILQETLRVDSWSWTYISFLMWNNPMVCKVYNQRFVQQFDIDGNFFKYRSFSRILL